MVGNRDIWISWTFVMEVLPLKMLFRNEKSKLYSYIEERLHQFYKVNNGSSKATLKSKLSGCEQGSSRRHHAMLNIFSHQQSPPII